MSFDVVFLLFMIVILLFGIIMILLALPGPKQPKSHAH